MGDARRISAVLVAIAAVSCGGTEPDFYVHSAGVVVESPVPFASQPDFPWRIETTIGAALEYWGGDWSVLDGRTITLSGAASIPCGDSTGALGCYDGDVRITTSDAGTGPVDCIEQTVLVHEIGHAVLGDPRHTDPRWMQFEPVRAALSGRVGYTADGEVDCTIHVCVWQHPLGVP